MFGLCMPTGTTYLLMSDGTKVNIAIGDESNPRKYIMNDEHILEWVKKKDYHKVKGIMYQWGKKSTTVLMADYYAEHGKELEGK